MMSGVLHGVAEDDEENPDTYSVFSYGLAGMKNPF